MSYRLRRKQSVSRNFIRIGCNRLEHAITCLRTPDDAVAVHGARKDIKKTRAVLRLAGGSVKRERLRRITAELRRVAAQLAGPRDAYVKTLTLEKLAQASPDLATDSFSRLTGYFEQAANDEFQALRKAKRLQRIDDRLRRTRAYFKDLKLTNKGWKAIRGGLAQTYRQGRRHMHQAGKEPTPENLHEWRKRVKTLGYQMALLKPIWPEQIEALGKDLDAIGERLGDHHDLAVLVEEAESSGCINRNDLGTLRRIVGERQGELWISAQQIGLSVYSEKAAHFANRLAGYWINWRRAQIREEQPLNTSASAKAKAPV